MRFSNYISETHWQFTGILPMYNGRHVNLNISKVIIIWQKFVFEATLENNIFSEILDKSLKFLKNF